MFGRFGLMLRTIRFIKPVQIAYQLKNRLITVRSLTGSESRFEVEPQPLQLITDLREISSVKGDIFTFLNLRTSFPGKINWNFSAHGKLWNYNLQYLDFIHQKDIQIEKRINWIKDIYSNLNSGELKPEPYPASLRIMNLIRFFSDEPSLVPRDSDIQRGLYAELHYLNSNYEYHILGNHLLENAFAMLMGGYYFQQNNWVTKAEHILRDQLNEQILSDGAHFELSPMYHMIMLTRVLEAVSYTGEKGDLNKFLREKASKMLGWLSLITFGNGDVPHFNDSANGITLPTEQFTSLALMLNLTPAKVKLSKSGYRKLLGKKVELIADVHGITPSYQPGHAHADHLSFVLYSHNKPFIVDPGTSTYSISERRDWERSSIAHNTVTIGYRNQSEVWSGFRVGRRAKVAILEDRDDFVMANVSYPGVSHKRTFKMEDNALVIEDSIDSGDLASLRMFLHPLIRIHKVLESEIYFESGEMIRLKGNCEMKINEYEFAMGFNKLEKSSFIEVFFRRNCQVIINIE